MSMRVYRLGVFLLQKTSLLPEVFCFFGFFVFFSFIETFIQKLSSVSMWITSDLTASKKWLKLGIADARKKEREAERKNRSPYSFYSIRIDRSTYLLSTIRLSKKQNRYVTIYRLRKHRIEKRRNSNLVNTDTT